MSLPDPPLSAEDRTLLQRHLPVLRYDPQFDFRTLAIASITTNPGNLLRRTDGEVIASTAPGWDPPLSLNLLGDYPAGIDPLPTDHLVAAPDYAGDGRRMQRDPELTDRIYGRVVVDGDRTWLQYWLWLYYNPKNLLGFGSHEGDWEMVQIGLNGNREPEIATYAQHTWAQSRRWADVGHFPTAGGPRPVVYVAALSHASYFEPGTHPYPTGIDHAYGDGPEVSDATLEEFGPWVHWPGHWGDVSRILGGRLGKGPRSPAWQDPKWDKPNALHNQARRRAGSRLLGRILAWLGKRTFPGQPEISADLNGAELEIRYHLPSSLGRRTRHLYVTVHTGRRADVVASRVVQGPAEDGVERIRLRYEPDACLVMASAFNRLRQRSSVAVAQADVI